MPVSTLPLAVPVKERLIFVDAPLCAFAAIARPRKRKITKVERRSRINEILELYNMINSVSFFFMASSISDKRSTLMLAEPSGRSR